MSSESIWSEGGQDGIHFTHTQEHKYDMNLYLRFIDLFQMMTWFWVSAYTILFIFDLFYIIISTAFDNTLWYFAFHAGFSYFVSNLMTSDNLETLNRDGEKKKNIMCLKLPRYLHWMNKCHRSCFFHYKSPSSLSTFTS